MQMVGFDQARAEMDKLGMSTDKLVQSQNTVAGATDKTDKALKASKLTMTGMVSSLGTVTSSSWNLYNSWDSLEKVQLTAQRSQTKLKSSMEAVDQAQKKLNEAIAKYGPTSDEARDAADKLAIAQDRLADAQTKAEIATGDVAEAQAQFATSLPMLVTGIVSSVASFASLSKEMGGLKSIIPSVISAVSALGTAFRFLFTNPIGIAIMAIVTAFTLLATNAFGVRDAINALGKAFGDALPGIRGFLETFGANVNAFLNFINPAQDATAQLDAMGTSAQGTGESLQLAEAQVRGLDGSLVNLSDVVYDVVTAHHSLMMQQTQNNEAYEAWKTAITTGNNDVVASYNLTAEDIKKFEDQYEKEMKDSAKAAEEAANKAYEAWKKSIEKSRQEVEGGFGVLKSGFSKIQSDIASALDEGGKQFKKTLKKYGLDPENPLVMEAIVNWAVNTVDAEDKMTSFTEYVAQNIESMKNGTGQTFSSMISQWVSYISDEEPKAAEAAGAWGTSMIAKINEKINSGQPPAQAFLESIRETLDPSTAEQIASLFGIKFPETTKAEFEKGTPAVATAAGNMSNVVGTSLSPTVAEGYGTIFGKGVTVKTVEELNAGKPTIDTATANITTGMNTTLTTGLATVKTTMTTKLPESIVTPLTALKPKVTTATTDVFGGFAQGVADAFEGVKTTLGGAWTAFVNFFTGTKTESTTSQQSMTGDQQLIQQAYGQTGSTAQTELGGVAVGAVGVLTDTSTTSKQTLVDNANFVIAIWKGMSTYAQSIFQTQIPGYLVKTQQASSTLSSTISTHMKSMTSAVNSFGSAFSSQMSKITSSMKTATSAAKSLASAINALKSKTITITTRYVTQGSPAGMHGAQFLSGFQHGGAFFHAQGGFSGVVNRPTNFKGGRMGEGFRPELVTVTPLTRGTGNHTGATVSSGSSIGGGGGAAPVINVTVVLDGRVIQRFVEKTALAGIGMQV